MIAKHILNRLAYFQEDVVLHIKIIGVILLFGFNFKIMGWIAAVLCTSQFIYTCMKAYKCKQLT